METVEKIKGIYTEKVKEYGDDTRSCMWAVPQISRYTQLSKIAVLDHCRILDVGSGLGGFYEFLVEQCKVSNIKYTGVEIVNEMVEIAKNKYPEAVFLNKNLFHEELNESYDYGFLCGVFNNNIDNANQYMEEMLLKTYQYCEKGLAFNFISDYVNFKDDVMQYYSPEKVMQFCINNLSRKVTMNHHYDKCDVSVYVYR